MVGLYVHEFLRTDHLVLYHSFRGHRIRFIFLLLLRHVSPIIQQSARRWRPIHFLRSFSVIVVLGGQKIFICILQTDLFGGADSLRPRFPYLRRFFKLRLSMIVLWRLNGILIHFDTFFIIIAGGIVLSSCVHLCPPKHAAFRLLNAGKRLPLPRPLRHRRTIRLPQPRHHQRRTPTMLCPLPPILARPVNRRIIF